MQDLREAKPRETDRGRVNTMIEKLKTAIDEKIEIGTARTRWECLMYSVGYCEKSGSDSVPVEIINYIDELAYAEKIKF